MKMIPYMFLGMYKFENIDFYALREIRDISGLDSFESKIAGRGRLNLRVCSHLVDELMVPTENIGSISLKFIFQGIKISLRVFKSGQVKISGGFSEKNNTGDKFLEFTDAVIEIFEPFFGKYKTWIVSLINFHFKLKLDRSVRTMFNNIEKTKFYKIEFPDYNTTKTSGRRDVFKIYPEAKSKFQMILNDSASCQILAAKSFAQAQALVDVFLVSV